MLLAAIRKDILLLLRDRGAVMSLFLLPIVFIAVFGSIFGGDGDRRPLDLAVWHAGDDARGEQIAEALAQTGMFTVRRAATAEQARALVADEEVVAAVVIPADLDPRAGRPVELVIDEGASPQIKGPVQSAVHAIVSRVVLGPPPGAELKVVEVRQPPGVREALSVSGFQVAVPGNAVLFGFFIALTCALSFVEERRTGTWRRLLAAPVARWRLLIAKLVPYILVGMIQFALLFGVGIVAFGLEVAGSPLALIALIVATVICATSLGLAMASLGGSEKQLGGIGSITLLVMGLLGGAMVPRVVMPETMQLIGLAVPHGWALDGFFDVLVRPGTDLGDVWLDVAALLGFATLFAGFGAARSRRLLVG
jgi:ABC-2 type transport system permease protein